MGIEDLGSNLGGEDEAPAGAAAPAPTHTRGKKAVAHAHQKKAKPAGPASQYPAPEGVDDFYWLQLEPSEDVPPTGLYVGHNGRGYLIETGKPVRVAWFIKAILDDAVQSMAIINPSTRQVDGHRERRRFDYRLVDAPDDEAENA